MRKDRMQSVSVNEIQREELFKMSKADYTYYVEVTTRCSAKLMKAAYQ